jgi:hypothetical protein
MGKRLIKASALRGRGRFFDAARRRFFRAAASPTPRAANLRWDSLGEFLALAKALGEDKKKIAANS